MMHRHYRPREARRHPRQIESAEQAAVVEWARHLAPRHPELANLLAIPNGGSRHVAEAARLKREGVQAGVPDLLLAWPAADAHGLWLEMKRPKERGVSAGRVRPAQREWHRRLRAAGYRVVTCYGAAEAARTIVEYLMLPTRCLPLVWWPREGAA